MVQQEHDAVNTGRSGQGTGMVNSKRSEQGHNAGGRTVRWGMTQSGKVTATDGEREEERERESGRGEGESSGRGRLL
jgi:hypothetical protein